jgi:hypothetical protein
VGGRTIKLYIMGVDYSNLRSAELSNWSGKAFIGLRKHSNLIKGLAELGVPGIYMLIAKDQQSFLTKLYIGEADTINNRIYNHYVQKDWWDTFVAFVSKDANLTKSHVRYLEKELHSVASKNAPSIEILNESEPTGSKLPQPDVDDMNEYLANMLFMLENLGIVDFAAGKSEVDIVEKELFFLSLTRDRVDSNGNVVQARMAITKDGYRLLKGSYIENEQRESFADHPYYALRRNLDEKGYFEASEIPGCKKLRNNTDFTSPSAAAAIVKNRAVNGRKEWKQADGTTLDDFEAKIKK